MSSQALTELYDALRAAFGHRAWWPAETPWEMMAGAILTQNTNWKNVERAIENLKAAEAMAARPILKMPEPGLQELIRPAGYFRQKGARLRRLAQWWIEEMNEDVEAFRSADVHDLRASLLAIKGIGPETADSIVLYAAELATFVVDTYTARVCVRHGLMEPGASYEDIQSLFEYALPRDVALYQDYHAQLVEVGKNYCRKRPKCAGCPVRGVLGEALAEFLPEE